MYASDDDGNRRVRTGLLSGARGQGKTVLAALLCLCHLSGPESELRGECYSAGATKDQSALIFAEMEAVIFAVPWLAARLNVQRFHKRIEDLANGSNYHALPVDGSSVHGLASSLPIFHDHAQRKER